MEAVDFMIWMNDQDRFLRFTNTLSKEKLTFLDLDISVKESARNCLLRFDSYHPRHLRENLPFGQFLRLHRNCSEVEDFVSQANDLSLKLRKRKYPEKILRTACKRARNNHRETLLEENEQKQEYPRIVCVSTYNPLSNKMAKIVNKHWNILNSNHLDIPKPIFAHKRGRNIKDMIVHTRPKPVTFQTLNPSILPSVKGHFPCGNCSVCRFTKHTKEIRFENGFKWELRGHTNCNTQRVIYLLTCPCDLMYIGMTTRKIKIRIGEHRSNIRCHKNNTKMTIHFLEKGPQCR